MRFSCTHMHTYPLPCFYVKLHDIFFAQRIHGCCINFYFSNAYMQARMMHSSTRNDGMQHRREVWIACWPGANDFTDIVTTDRRFGPARSNGFLRYLWSSAAGERHVNIGGQQLIQFPLCCIQQSRLVLPAAMIRNGARQRSAEIVIHPHGIYPNRSAEGKVLIGIRRSVAQFSKTPNAEIVHTLLPNPSSL